MRYVDKLFESNNIERDSFVWNTIAGGINTLQSVIILMIVSRVCGSEDAGIFSLGYSTASLFMVVGNYNMRNFQVTDTNQKYTFSDYVFSRIVTLTIMFVVSTFYCLYGYFFNAYSMHKIAIIFCVCLLKMIEAGEDIVYGQYQLQGRLDIGSKALTIRYVLSIGSLMLLLFFIRDLATALVISVIISFLIAMSMIKITDKIIEQREFVWSIKKVVSLLTTTFSVFISGFLAMYISNAPKYAIDRFLSDEEQAYYGYIAMPVFVISLINIFLYQPILTKMAIAWKERQIKVFLGYIGRQFLLIGIFSIIVLIGGYLLGIPILSMLYSVDLSMYKTEFMIILLGGSALAVVGFLTVLLTIIRCQNSLAWGYLFGTIIAAIISPLGVANYGMMGASMVYVISYILLIVIFGSMFIWQFIKKIRREK